MGPVTGCGVQALAHGQREQGDRGGAVDIAAGQGGDVRGAVHIEGAGGEETFFREMDSAAMENEGSFSWEWTVREHGGSVNTEAWGGGREVLLVPQGSDLSCGVSQPLSTVGRSPITRSLPTSIGVTGLVQPVGGGT